MIIDTIDGQPIVAIKMEKSAGINRPFGVTACDEWEEYGFSSKNLTLNKVKKIEVSNRKVFEDFVRYHGAQAYDKLKEMNFKFE